MQCVVCEKNISKYLVFRLTNQQIYIKLTLKLQDTSIIFKFITIHTIKYTEAMKMTAQKSCTWYDKNFEIHICNFFYILIYVQSMQTPNRQKSVMYDEILENFQKHIPNETKKLCSHLSVFVVVLCYLV